MALNTVAKIGGDGALLYAGPTTITSMTTSVVTATSGWTTFAEVNTINVEPTQAEANVTSLNSGAFEEYVPGHVSCVVSCNANLVEHGTQFDTRDIIDAWQARTPRCYKVRIPVNSTNTSNGYLAVGFFGFPTGASLSITDGDEAMGQDFNIRVSDSILVEALADA